MIIEETKICTINDESIFKIVLENNNNLRVSIITYGGTISEILLPDKESGFQNIVLSLEHIEDYKNNSLYLRANLGPNAGRIRNGEIIIDGKKYFVSKNEGKHNLHGGYKPVSFLNWEIDKIEKNNTNACVTLKTYLEDGLDGFPGRRQITATYTLDDSDRLTIDYKAISNKDTYFNLSNHSYFNLSGDFTKSGLNQYLYIDADKYIQTDEENIPIRFSSVDNSPFDFRFLKNMEEQICKYPNDLQIISSKGYNHGFDIHEAAEKGKPVLKLWDAKRTKGLKMYTDAPCVVIYSGGFIGDKYTLKGGVKSSDSCAIALEAQDYPDVFHLCKDNVCITRKNEIYKRKISYEFLY